MALAFLFPRSAESYALVEGDIVADDGGLSDHRPRAVVDEETPPKLSAGMDLDSSEQERDLRDESRQEGHPMLPQPVAQVMCPHGMQARIQEEYLNVGARSGVRLEDRGNVFPY